MIEFLVFQLHDVTIISAGTIGWKVLLLGKELNWNGK